MGIRYFFLWRFSVGEATAGLYVVTEQKAEYFFALYCFVLKP